MATAWKCQQCGRLLKDKQESRAHDCRKHTFAPVGMSNIKFCSKFRHTFRETAVKVGEECQKKKRIYSAESCGSGEYEMVPANVCKVSVRCVVCGYRETRNEVREGHELKSKKQPRS